MVRYTVGIILFGAAAVVLAYAGSLYYACAAWAIAGALAVRQLRLLARGRQNVNTVLCAIRNNDYTFSLKHDASGINESLNRIKTLMQDARREILEQEEFLSAIIECVPTGMIITNAEGLVRFNNRAALGYLSLPALTHTNKIRQLYPALAATLESIRDNESRTVAIETEKESRQLMVQRITVSLNSCETHIITLNDIHAPLDQRETDSWISLIRVMTHEIMNSVAPIRSISEVLLQDSNDALAPTAVKAIETIYSTSDSLMRFVEDYRKFSAVPQPKLTVVPVNSLIEQAATRIASEAHAKGISVSIELRASFSTLTADRGLVLQVLHNLLKNAVEASPSHGGAIVLSTLRAPTGRPAVSVFNSGTPIDAQIRPYIFTPFFTTKAGGSGIGLSLSRYIMRLHGGNLTYHPARGGNQFILEF